MIVFLFSCAVVTPEDVTPEVTQAYISPDEAAQGIEEAVDSLLWVDPLLMHDGWTNLMQTLPDGTCPSMEVHNDMDLWQESCTTEEGHQFMGWSLNFRGHGVPSGCCEFDEFDWLTGQAQIIHSDGTILQHFGDILHKEGYDGDGNKVVEGFIYGDFYWEDRQAENSWLQSEISMEYYYTFTKLTDHEQVDIQAFLSNFSTDYSAAIFDDVAFNTSECEKEPVTGEIWIRDNQHLWYRVVYDSQTSCVGCGDVYQEDVHLGQACSSFTQLFSWENFPWENR